MPEFLLRYKIPDEACTDVEVEDVREQAMEMARLIRAKASEIFFGWGVTFEVRPFGDCEGQPDFSVTGWVTDKDDKFIELVEKAQFEILALMIRQTKRGRSVSCWWQRVRGVWGSYPRIE